MNQSRWHVTRCIDMADLDFLNRLSVPPVDSRLWYVHVKLLCVCVCLVDGRVIDFDAFFLLLLLLVSSCLRNGLLEHT